MKKRALALILAVIMASGGICTSTAFAAENVAQEAASYQEAEETDPASQDDEPADEAADTDAGISAETDIEEEASVAQEEEAVQEQEAPGEENTIENEDASEAEDASVFEEEDAAADEEADAASFIEEAEDPDDKQDMDTGAEETGLPVTGDVIKNEIGDEIGEEIEDVIEEDIEIAVSKKAATDNEWYQADTGSCGNNVTYYIYWNNVDLWLKLTGSGSMDMTYHKWEYWKNDLRIITMDSGISYMDWGAFADLSELREVTLADNLTNISDYAFENCEDLEGISIPGKVSSIGSSAFSGCTSLAYANLPNSLEKIETYAFENCSSLTSINIPNSVKEIGGSTFVDCTSLRSVTIPSKVTQLEGSTFRGCSSLTSVSLPDDLVSIGWYAFYDCGSLSSLDIPDGVKRLGAYMFSGCDSLPEVIIPDSVNMIADNAFDGYSGLIKVYYDSYAEQYCQERGLNYKSICKSHTWSQNYTVDRQPTCSQEGLKSIHCEKCGEIKEGSEQAIAKLDHNYGSWQTVTAATCVKAGSRKRICQACGDVQTETIPAKGHTWSSNYTVDKQPTCSEEGSKSIHCDACGAIKSGSTVAIPKLDHTYGNWETVTEPTATTEGLRKRSCTVCGAEETEAIPVLPTYQVTFDTENCVLSVYANDSDETDGTLVNDGDYVAVGTVLTVTATPIAGCELTVRPNASYNVSGDLTITAKAAYKRYRLNLSYQNSSAPTANVSDLTSILYGTSVTLTAGAPASGYEFIGWYQTNGKRLTADEQYTFMMFGDTTCEARYQVLSRMVTFMANDSIIKTVTAASISDADFPAAPIPSYGYSFTGWDKTVAKVNAELAAGRNVTVTAKFKVLQQDITLTIYNGESKTPEKKNYTNSQWVSVTAAPVSGKNFAYWTMDGEILSYNATAEFRIASSCTVIAVYTADTVEAVGTATIKTATYDKSSNKLITVAYMTVPKGAVIEKAGLFAASSASGFSPATQELNESTAEYVKSSSKAVGTGGPLNYTWRKTNVSIGDTWYLRSYVSYMYNGKLETIFGMTVTVSAGYDYDGSEKGTASIISASYDSEASKAVFVAYMTIPSGGSIVKAGLVAASRATFDPAASVLTWENAEYRKESAKAVGTAGPLTYTWRKTNVHAGDTWYARPYVIYTDANGIEHTVYGALASVAP